MIKKFIKIGGTYPSVNITGDDKNKDTGLRLHIPKNQLVYIPKINISNVFLGVRKTGEGKLICDDVDIQRFGGDAINLNGDVDIENYKVAHCEPTRPYNICYRVGDESIDQCLERNNEIVYDSSLLRFEIYKNKEVIIGYHCDSLFQAFDNDTQECGNVRIHNIHARICGDNVQGGMLSEPHRYFNFQIGTGKVDIKIQYPYAFVANSLEDSHVNVGNNGIKIKNVKNSTHESKGNTLVRCSGKQVIIGDCKKYDKIASKADILKVIIEMDKKRAIYLQGLLHANGYHLKIDGIWGKNTQKALDSFVESKGFKKKKAGGISQKALDALRGSVPKRTKSIIKARSQSGFRTSSVDGLPKSTDFSAMVRFYGHPNDNMLSNLVRVYPAYRLKYGTATVKSIRVHKKCAEAFKAVFEEILEVYGQEEIELLGLDKYSGTYNKRKIRGGRSWSNHAFGCAIDMHARDNELYKSFDDSLFSKPEYKKFMNIWRKHGFVNLGEAINRDSMHWQYASV